MQAWRIHYSVISIYLLQLISLIYSFTCYRQAIFFYCALVWGRLKFSTPFRMTRSPIWNYFRPSKMITRLWNNLISCQMGSLAESQVLEHSVLSGWNSTSRQLILYFNEQHIDLYDLFISIEKKIGQNQTTFLEELILLLPEDSPSLNMQYILLLFLSLEPCYLWAQNMTHILMKIKFSTKLDIPGALHIHRFSLNITMPELFLSAYSFEYDTPIRYILRIETYKFMNPHYFHYYEAELGQYVIEILKSPSPYFWKNIHSQQFYHPPNQYTWWDMYFQYRKQLEVAFGLLEDQENQREEQENQKLNEEDDLIEGKRALKKLEIQEQTVLDEELLQAAYCRMNGNYCWPYDANEWNSWL